MLATLDKFGRVLIPKKLRDHLGIKPDTSINIVKDGKRIIIEAIEDEDPIINKNGLLIFTGKLQGNLETELQADRLRRAKSLLNRENEL
ncbi:MAG: AbrB/MazE/SpoVT family DNA-binding domain-containing protein [Ignavibacteriae bacterium]|nr:AbrB/MazE/SpoVT family DNA-binding domain-containing protein [Ignavibacteriota bacterium]NOG98978.1 AbrB/MazE/SpoVT family DNA-binding domain-containing protein [Ignavibacteriota bacterium]